MLVKRAVNDFSSPNVAKEVYFGYLRSTIIEDTLPAMFQFLKSNVLQRNHVGDWGGYIGSKLLVMTQPSSRQLYAIKFSLRIM